MRHKNGIERGLRITPPELLPHSGCGATQPPRPLQWGLRQEGIFGRFWYHNVSFRKQNTGRERRCQVRVGGAPSVTAPQPGGAPGQDPNRLLQVLGSQEAAKPPPQLLPPGWFFGGARAQKLTGRAPYRTSQRLFLYKSPRHAPPSREPRARLPVRRQVGQQATGPRSVNS